MSDRLSESSQVVQDDVRVRAKFILTRFAQMFSIEHRQIGIRVESCKDETSLWMEYAVQVLNRGEWRRDERKRQIADDAMDGVVLEGKSLRPISLHPFGGHGRIACEGACEVVVDLSMQSTKTLSSVRQRVV